MKSFFIVYFKEKLSQLTLYFQAIAIVLTFIFGFVGNGLELVERTVTISTFGYICLEIVYLQLMAYAISVYKYVKGK